MPIILFSHCFASDKKWGKGNQLNCLDYKPVKGARQKHHARIILFLFFHYICLSEASSTLVALRFCGMLRHKISERSPLCVFLGETHFFPWHGKSSGHLRNPDCYSLPAPPVSLHWIIRCYDLYLDWCLSLHFFSLLPVLTSNHCNLLSSPEISHASLFSHCALWTIHFVVETRDPAFTAD